MQAITGGQPQYLGIPLPFSLTTLLAIVCPDSISWGTASYNIETNNVPVRCQCMRCSFQQCL